SGIFWVLVCLLPASSILQLSHRLIPDTLVKITAAAVLTLGLIMADMLGIAVYGSWLPFGHAVDWLVVNNSTVFAFCMILTAALLSSNPHFNNHIATLSGYLIVAVSVLALLTLVWLQPALDAPVQSSASRNLSQPPFNAVSLLFFGSLLAVLLRFLGSRETPVVQQGAADSRFFHWHLLSLYQLLFSLLMVIGLAAAMGIGAWKTHYLEWSWDLNLLRHYEIALTSLFELASFQSDIGSMAHTAFMSALFCIALSLLLTSFQHLRLEASNQKRAQDLWTMLRRSKIGHSVVIFIVSCYFLNRGIPLTIWIITGILAWLLVTQFVIRLACKTNPQGDSENQPNRLLSGLCLVLVALGLMQLFRLSLWWAQQGHWLAALLAAIFMLIAVILWFTPVRELLGHFAADKDDRIFD
ncbi:MAG: hypothetical protein KJP04_07060, partial [Arenicella sp.]|nr:hypothetical protein [Arenicella sp.]